VIIPLATLSILSARQSRHSEPLPARATAVIYVSRRTNMTLLLIFCPLIVLEILLLTGLAAGVK
jgi:hypothetical protein